MAKASLKDRLLQKQKNIKSQQGGFKYMTIKEGTLRARPCQVGEDNDFSMEVIWVFPNKEIGGFVSPRTFGEKCAWMDKYDELTNSKSDSDRKFAKAKMSGRRKALMPHLVYKDVKGQEPDKVLLLLLTPGQISQLIDLWTDDQDGGDFTDPLKGYDIKYKRTGTTMTDTEYTLLKCNPSKMPKEFRGVVNLEEMVRELTPTYKETKEYVKQFLNTRDESAEEEEEERPKKKKKKKKNRDL